MLTGNTELIEIVVNAGPGGTASNKIIVPIPNQNYLNGTFCKSIEIFTASDMTISPQQNAIITDAIMKTGYLTLYTTDPNMAKYGPDSNKVRGQGEYIRKLPLACLHTLENGVAGSPFERTPFLMQGQIVSWDKCFITLGTALTNTANISFLLNIGFDWNPAYKAS